VAAVDLSASAVKFYPRRETIVDLEEVVLIARDPTQPSTGAGSAFKHFSRKPVDHIQVVDVLLDDVVAMRASSSPSGLLSSIPQLPCIQ